MIRSRYTHLYLSLYLDIYRRLANKIIKDTQNHRDIIGYDIVTGYGIDWDVEPAMGSYRIPSSWRSWMQGHQLRSGCDLPLLVGDYTFW